ncbi:MAG: SPOR domain-containing protein [Pseudomonadota bacterium]
MVADKRQKKRFVFRFELGIGGMVGLGVVCFCIFLWMFLLGVWSGQAILLPASPGKGADMLTRMASELWEKGKSAQQDISRLQDIPKKSDTGDEIVQAPQVIIPTDSEPEPSFFSLQVGSFRDKKKAHREVLGWQAKGQDAFYLEPEEGTDTYRVFIGRYEKLTDANVRAVGLEKEEDVRAYITLLPASKLTGSAGK